MNEERKDTDRLGLSERSRQILDEIQADCNFNSSLSIYRLAVACGIYEKVDISNHIVNRPSGHMYLISQFDPDNIFANVIDNLFPHLKSQKYRALEKFADLGVHRLHEHLQRSNDVVFWT